MDALSYPCENILTRRANQGHYSTIAQFVKRPWPFPTTASSARLQAKSLPTIEVAAARHSEGSPLALPSRARFRCACPRRYRREHSSRPQQGNGTSRNRSNHGCRSPADKALVTWILHRPSRSGAWRTAHGGRIGVADRDAMHGILRQLLGAADRSAASTLTTLRLLRWCQSCALTLPAKPR